VSCWLVETIICDCEIMQIGSVSANVDEDSQWSQGLISAVSHLVDYYLLHCEFIIPQLCDIDSVIILYYYCDHHCTFSIPSVLFPSLL